MNMKSTVLSLLLALLCLQLPAAAEPFRPALLITHADGASVKYVLETLPVLSFSGESLTVTCQGQSEVYPRTELSSLRYVDDPHIPSGIGSASRPHASAVTFTDLGLTVYTPSAAVLSVYSLQGQPVWSRTSAADSETRLEYADFTPGVYVLKCGSHAYKFVVR